MAQVALAVALVALAVSVTGQSNCIVEGGDGLVVDLTPLSAHNWGPIATTNGYAILLKPCGTLDYDPVYMPDGNGKCTSSAVACQLYNNYPAFLVASHANASIFNATVTNVAATGGDLCPGAGANRRATITLICGEGDGSPVYAGEKMCEYRFTWVTRHACPQPEPPGVPEYGLDTLVFKSSAVRFDLGALTPEAGNATVRTVIILAGETVELQRYGFACTIVDDSQMDLAFEAFGCVLKRSGSMPPAFEVDLNDVLAISVSAVFQNVSEDANELHWHVMADADLTMSLGLVAPMLLSGSPIAISNSSAAVPTLSQSSSTELWLSVVSPSSHAAPFLAVEDFTIAPFKPQ